jgi:hypothetical protein
VASKGRDDQDVIGYQSYTVPLEGGYHVLGDEPYWDRLSGQNGGWRHHFPTRRWELAKLTLLIAENPDWKLNRSWPVPRTLHRDHRRAGRAGRGRVRAGLRAEGGMPFYDWQVVDGALPEGLRDYDKLSTPVTAYTLIVTG